MSRERNIADQLTESNRNRFFSICQTNIVSIPYLSNTCHPSIRPRFRVNHSSTRSKKRPTRNPFRPPSRQPPLFHPHLHTDFTLVTWGWGGRPNIYEDVTVILISGLELISGTLSPVEGLCRSANINASTRLPRGHGQDLLFQYWGGGGSILQTYRGGYFETHSK